jgi:hypothetical protein
VKRFPFKKRLSGLASLLLPFLVCSLANTSGAFAQSRLTTFGIQVKPVFPLGFPGTGKQTEYENDIKFSISLKGGYNFGMVIRKGLSDLLAIETGINYVKRKYELELSGTAVSENSEFRMIGYEIPASLLVYIRLGEKIFMNASLGASCDAFASDVQSSGDNHFSTTYRSHIFQAAVIANLGWELRTEHSGYFYTGFSLHRPFDYEMVSEIHYTPTELVVYQPLSGSYLTVDLRYFFHEDPIKKQRKSTSDEE